MRGVASRQKMVGPERAGVVRCGKWLSWTTMGYNSLEGLLSLAAGAVAGSPALVGFGADSAIEVSAGLAALARLHSDGDPSGRHRAERRAQVAIGALFLALAATIAAEALRMLWGGRAPDTSAVGIVVASLSLVVMPLLARAKRRVAAQLSSPALRSEARQTEICWWLSAFLLCGLGLNAALGWWWADPVAAIAMTPLVVYEGVQSLRGRVVCGDCAPPVP